MNIAEDVIRDMEGANTGQSKQYLTFTLAGEEYGVEILRVQEVKGWAPVTRVPRSPDYVQGVLNLRGTIVPVIDLRIRFGIEHVEYTRTTVIIVISIQTEKSRKIIGIVVDGVSDVINVLADNIKASPDFGTHINTEFIPGLVTLEDKMVMLIDIDKLLTSDEMTSLDGLG